MLRVRDVARRFGVTNYFVYGWINSGALRAARLSPGGQWLIRAEDVERFEAEFWRTPEGRDLLPGGRLGEVASAGHGAETERRDEPAAESPEEGE